MDKRQFVIVFSIVVSVFLFLIPSALSEVIVFDTYETTYELRGGNLYVEKQLRLKNVGNSPIIPGEIHFKISQEGKDDSPEINNYIVSDAREKELDTQLIKSGGESSLVFTVWDPLLPNFFYDVTMTYQMKFRPKGVLFYSVILPQEKTTIPIKKFASKVILPKKNHITYAPDAEVESTKEGRQASWSEQGAVSFEYSIIPLPKLGFKAVNLFWIVIMSIFVIQLFLKIRKLRRL